MHPLVSSASNTTTDSQRHLVAPFDVSQSVEDNDESGPYHNLNYIAVGLMKSETR